MTKETRINLIFLSVFLAVSLPGGVILFKKTLDPTRPPSFVPDRPRDRIPYMDPREAPDLNRYVPPLTAQWLDRVAAEHGVSRVLAPDHRPITSPSHRLQLVAEAPKVQMVLWDAPPSQWTLTVDGRELPAESETIDVPNGVRQELIYAGYAQPPKRVLWISAVIPAAATRPSTLVFTADGFAESVPLFTN